jgi:hypothetical protein
VGATVITLVVGLTVDVGNAPSAEVARAAEAAEAAGAHARAQ